jgi:small-conductance mechanosensitive channel
MDPSERLDVESQVLDIQLFHLGDTSVTVATFLLFVFILFATVVASRILQRALAQGLRLRGIDHRGALATSQRILHYVVLTVGVAVALETVGVDLGALFAAAAIFAIAISFAMQNIAQNFVSGVILLVERSIKPGDVLQVEDRVVKVERMGIRATVAQTLDNEEVIIPNASLVQSVVTNYTLEDSVYRLRTTVSVPYRSDPTFVRKTLEEAAAAMEWRLRTHEPLVLLLEFGPSALLFEVSVWMDNPWTARRTRSQLNEAIWEALRRAGVEIAAPRVDVRMDRVPGQGSETS